MEDISSKIKSGASELSSYCSTDKIRKILSNPYVFGVIALIAILYGYIVSSKIPPYSNISQWNNNPLVKILLFGLIILGHWYHPILGIVIILVYLIFLHILIYNSKPQQEIQVYPETNQVMQEMNQEPKPENQEPKPENQEDQSYLHPRNKPTEETNYRDNRVEDPNSPEQPAVITHEKGGLYKAIYELNPPYVVKEYPDATVSVQKTNTDIPSGGPSRYSAYHGYM